MPNSIIRIIKGDITKLQVDAIVNAANSSLLGGGGVDGAIHHAAGPKLLEECRTLGGCPTGEVRLTKGYNLPARFIIHTVGPVYGRSSGQEETLLSSCYYNAMKLAHDHQFKKIAFPAISTGIFGYPKLEATSVAIETVWNYIKQHQPEMEQVIFCCFDDQMERIYLDRLSKISGKPHS